MSLNPEVDRNCPQFPAEQCPDASVMVRNRAGRGHMVHSTHGEKNLNFPKSSGLLQN